MKHTIKLLIKNPLAIAGIVIVGFMVFIALLAPLLAPPYLLEQELNPYTIPIDYERYARVGSVSPPGYDGYILGSGERGADIYYGIVWGARVSIQVALIVVITALAIGLALGSIAGYYGKWIDEILMRVTDIFLSLPGLILAMAVAAVLSPTLENLMLALIIVWWPPYARIVRGQILSVKENTYVEAAKAAGAKRPRILFRHVVPNSLAPILVVMTMDMGSVVLVTAGLSYIGFGPPNLAEWGGMIAQGQQLFIGNILYDGQLINPYWVVLFPGIMIFLFVMGFNLLGDALRDTLDPRMRR